MGPSTPRYIDSFGRRIPVQKKGDFEEPELLVVRRREVKAFQFSSVGEEPIRCLCFRQIRSKFWLLMS